MEEGPTYEENMYKYFEGVFLEESSAGAKEAILGIFFLPLLFKEPIEYFFLQVSIKYYLFFCRILENVISN